MSDEEFKTLVLAEFKSLRQEIQGVRQEMDERFRKIDERFGKIDERFEKIDERFGKMDERFDRLERQNEENVATILKIIDSKVTDIRNDLRSITDVLGDHEVRIRTLERRTV